MLHPPYGSDRCLTRYRWASAVLSDRSADGRWPNAAFAPALEHSDVGRRGWQMLSSLFKRAVSRTELVATNPSTRPRRPTAWWQSLNGTVRWMKGTGSCGLLLPALRRRPNSHPSSIESGSKFRPRSRMTTTSTSSDFSPDSPKRCDRHPSALQFARGTITADSLP